MPSTKLRIIYIISLIFLTIEISQGQNILINEFVSNNEDMLLDIDGESSDWVELYNNSSITINLENYSLTDNGNDLDKWTFPTMDIAANSYLVIFASGKDKIESGEVHTNFKISQSGEPLFLTNDNAEIISQIPATFVPANQSFGSIIDGSPDKSILTPTPNGSNSNGNGILGSLGSGFYEEAFLLNLETSNSNQQIYYTINGGIPNTNSQLYNSDILIENHTNLSNNYSLIPTTPLEGPSQLYEYVWQQPQSVYQANVLRYASFENGAQQSNLFTKTYFVDSEIAQRYEFPIVSIVTDSLNLFDYETGIYIPGKRFDNNGFDWWPQGNYLYKGRDWEREVHITYFKEDGSIAFESNAGMRMRGTGSVSLPQKSFGIYFRKEYGRKDIEYPVFDSLNVDRYKRLIFRSSGNDFLSTHFRDALLQHLLHPLDIETQNLKPSIVFINGEYWGIHNIREKYDRFYFSEHFDIEEEDVNVLGFCGQIEEGTDVEYLELRDFLENNDLSITDNYTYIQEKVDILNFMDFQIAEIYFANYDWPCNNYKMWKSNDANSKWRFLIYDLDLSFGFSDNASVYTNSLEHSTSTENSWPYCECSNLLFRSLLRNDDFKEQFINRFIHHLNHTFDSGKINQLIDQFETLYNNEIEEHINRWNYPVNKVKWKEEIEELRFFANNRPCIMTNHLMNFFELESFDFNCNPSIGENNGNVILMNPNPNNGNFSLYNNSEESIEGNITIFNSIGETVYENNNIIIAEGVRYNIFTTNLANGSYVLVVENGDMKEVIKFVVVE